MRHSDYVLGLWDHDVTFIFGVNPYSTIVGDLCFHGGLFGWATVLAGWTHQSGGTSPNLKVLKTFCLNQNNCAYVFPVLLPRECTCVWPFQIVLLLPSHPPAHYEMPWWAHSTSLFFWGREPLFSPHKLEMFLSNHQPTFPRCLLDLKKHLHMVWRWLSW